MRDESNRIHVVITHNHFDEATLNSLRELSPNLHIEQYDGTVPDDVWATTEILYSIGRIFPEADQAPNLRWIQLNSAGANHLLRYPIGQQEDIILTTASGIHARQMANYTLMLMMAFNYKLPELFENQRDNVWREDRHDYYQPLDMHRQTLGIVGYGTIGRELARVADGMGMRVLASKRDPKSPADAGYTPAGTGDPEGKIPERIYPSEALLSMVRECDYLVIITPLTPATRHLINADVFNAMKDTALIVNIARGSVIDEAAMIEALREGKIAGAALDVFEEEPLPKDSPLWNLPNVMLTPHISGNSASYSALTAELFTANLKRYLKNQPLLNELNRKIGY